MKTVAVVFALAASTAVLSACHRADNNNQVTANPADIRADSVPPASPSVTPTTPPALPPTPALPSGAGDATPPGVSASGTPPAGGGKTSDARDTAANAPTETLTKEQESNEMPKAGQANNHSSTSMEESRGQSPQR